MTDARTAVRIREILQEIGGYEDVTVAVSEGVVTLRGTTGSVTAINWLVSLVGRIEGVVTIKNEVTETTDLRRRLDPAMNRFMSRIYHTMAMVPLMLIALSSLAAFSLAGYALASLRWPWDRMAPNAFVADLYRQMVWIGFTMVGIVVALDVMDASELLSTILGAAGLVGLAIGFAVRDTVENYIASIFLSVRQPFRPNDMVDIEGCEGKVIRLTSRATILLSLDGNHIRIPNATVFKARIVNYSENRERRFVFRVKVSATNDLHVTRLLATQTVQDLPFVLQEPVAQVWIETIADGAVEIVVTGWIDQTVTSIVLANGEAMRHIKLAFEDNGIAQPDATLAVQLSGTAPVLPHRPGTPALPDTADTVLHATPTPPVPAARPVESHDVEEVTAVNEVLLEQRIAIERGRDEKQDFLTDHARKE